MKEEMKMKISFVKRNSVTTVTVTEKTKSFFILNFHYHFHQLRKGNIIKKVFIAFSTTSLFEMSGSICVHETFAIRPRITIDNFSFQ